MPMHSLRAAALSDPDKLERAEVKCLVCEKECEGLPHWDPVSWFCEEHGFEEDQETCLKSTNVKLSISAGSGTLGAIVATLTLGLVAFPIAFAAVGIATGFILTVLSDS
jgi:hypothetical protein